MIAMNRATMGLGTTLLWLDMLLNTGQYMLSLSTCHRTYEVRWNLCSTWTSHILRPGENCTTLTPLIAAVEPFTCSRRISMIYATDLLFITRHCVDSKI